MSEKIRQIIDAVTDKVLSYRPFAHLQLEKAKAGTEVMA